MNQQPLVISHSKQAGLLLAAVLKNDIEQVTFLFDAGVSPMTNINFGSSVLHVAAFNNFVDMIKLAVERGVDVDLVRKNTTALCCAAQKDSLEAAAWLLEHGAWPDNASKDTETPLYIAARRGRARMAKLLIHHGATLDPPQCSPLIAAIRSNHAHVVDILLGSGADPNRSVSHTRPLDEAARLGYLAIAEVLLDRDDTARNNSTAFYHAVKNNDTSMVQLLLRRNVNTCCVRPPIQTAIVFGHLELAAFLIQHEVDINATRTESNETALHAAVRRNYVELTTQLIDKGAIVDARTNLGFTPLFVAVRYGLTPLADLLIQAGADVGAQSKDSAVPLSLAIIRGDLRTATLLLDNGADIEQVAADGCRPLHFAVHMKNVGAAMLLLERGANANALTYKGHLVSHFAVTQKDHVMLEIIQRYLKQRTPPETLLVD